MCIGLPLPHNRQSKIVTQEFSLKTIWCDDWDNEEMSNQHKSDRSRSSGWHDFSLSFFSLSLSLQRFLYWDLRLLWCQSSWQFWNMMVLWWWWMCVERWTHAHDCYYTTWLKDTDCTHFLNDRSYWSFACSWFLNREKMIMSYWCSCWADYSAAVVHQNKDNILFRLNFN